MQTNRVAIITGSSRGIGRALALGLARAGYRVVVAAKSETSTQALPGSIHEVADAIRANGGEALALRVDVRDENQLHDLAARTIAHFGRIDVLINNAGALWWKPLLETPSKRFDLVMAVNVRAAFFACQAVVPAMTRQGGGHIINMSPPLDLSILPGRVAYGISKLGMSLLTKGLAVELAPRHIAVNSLWPVTVIESQASIHWNLGTPADWRKPDILVDCVTRLVAQDPAVVTGQHLLDEDFLRAEGVTDFTPYACVPGATPRMLTWDDLPAT